MTDDELLAEVAALTEQRDRLAKAARNLARFAWHSQRCERQIIAAPAPCTCGFRQATTAFEAVLASLDTDDTGGAE